MTSAGRKHLCLRLAPEHRVLRLAGRKRRQPAFARNRRSRIDLFSGPLTEPDGPYLACFHRSVQRGHGLRKGRLLVKAVALVKIDCLHAQPLKRPVQLLLNLCRRQPVIRLIAHRKVELGGHHKPVSRIGIERLAQHSLCLASSILVCGIEERNPVIHGCMDAPDRLFTANTTSHR